MCVNWFSFEFAEQNVHSQVDMAIRLPLSSVTFLFPFQPSTPWVGFYCVNQGSHSTWKTWKTWKMSSTFSSQGKVREFDKNPSNQGKIREFDQAQKQR